MPSKMHFDLLSLKNKVAAGQKQPLYFLGYFSVQSTLVSFQLFELAESKTA
jgi:hypothetical protein